MSARRLFEAVCIPNVKNANYPCFLHCGIAQMLCRCNYWHANRCANHASSMSARRCCEAACFFTVKHANNSALHPCIDTRGAVAAFHKIAGASQNEMHRFNDAQYARCDGMMCARSLL